VFDTCVSDGGLSHVRQLDILHTQEQLKKEIVFVNRVQKLYLLAENPDLWFW